MRRLWQQFTHIRYSIIDVIVVLIFYELGRAVSDRIL